MLAKRPRNASSRALWRGRTHRLQLARCQCEPEPNQSEVKSMSAAENKETVRQMREAKGIEPMLATMSDDVHWTIIGATKYSHTMNGKQEIMDKLLRPIFAEMESMGS